MGGLSLWHWLVVIILVMLLFGKGRISDMMGDLGKGLKSFKQGMADEDEQAKAAAAEQQQRQLPREQQQPIDVTPRPTADPATPPPPPATPGDETRGQ